MTNNFGNAGGFEKIYERIIDKENWCPIEILDSMVKSLSQLHACYQKKFAREFLPKLIKGIIFNIENSPPANLKNFRA
jgi:hypothetical protein